MDKKKQFVEKVGKLVGGVKKRQLLSDIEFGYIFNFFILRITLSVKV